jgi:hypothetical protein
LVRAEREEHAPEACAVDPHPADLDDASSLLRILTELSIRNARFLAFREKEPIVPSELLKTYREEECQRHNDEDLAMERELSKMPGLVCIFDPHLAKAYDSQPRSCLAYP